MRSRRCRCGLPWPCQEAELEALRDRYSGQADNIGAWVRIHRGPAGNDAGAPPTTRRDKRDNSGGR